MQLARHRTLYTLLVVVEERWRCSGNRSLEPVKGSLQTKVCHTEGGLIVYEENLLLINPLENVQKNTCNRYECGAVILYYGIIINYYTRGASFVCNKQGKYYVFHNGHVSMLEETFNIHYHNTYLTVYEYKIGILISLLNYIIYIHTCICIHEVRKNV